MLKLMKDEVDGGGDDEGSRAPARFTAREPSNVANTGQPRCVRAPTRRRTRRRTKKVTRSRLGVQKDKRVAGEYRSPVSTATTLCSTIELPRRLTPLRAAQIGYMTASHEAKIERAPRTGVKSMLGAAS